LSYGDPPPDNLSMSYDPVWNRVFLVMQLPQTYNAVNNSMVIMTGLQNIFDEQKVYPNLITNVPGNRFPSIAIANYKELKAGTVYVYGGALHYQFLSTLDDTTWNSSITPVDTSSSRGDCNILKSDGGGSLSVMYQRGDTGALYFKRSTAAGWASTFTVTDTGEWAACGQYDRPSMDLLSDGTAAAAYVTTTGNLIYAKWYCPPIGRCGFDHETVDTGLSAGSGGSTALAIGKVDNPNILYHKSGHLRFAYKTTPSALNWTIIAVDDTLDTYGPLSLETDKDGKLHAAYLSTMDYPYYARFGFGGNYWSAITQLENSSFTWDPLHVAVNSVTNLPQVSYDLEKKLILRTYACTILNCNWYSLTVDTPTDPSGLLKEISFAIDSKGKRSFAYFYSSPLQGEKGVKLMQVDGSINTSFMIQNGASIGDTSIALRPGDVPVIAYHVPGLGQLRVAWGPNRVFLPLIRR